MLNSRNNILMMSYTQTFWPKTHITRIELNIEFNDFQKMLNRINKTINQKYWKERERKKFKLMFNISWEKINYKRIKMKRSILNGKDDLFKLSKGNLYEKYERIIFITHSNYWATWNSSSNDIIQFTKMIVYSTSSVIFYDIQKLNVNIKCLKHVRAKIEGRFGNLKFCFKLYP